ncbi:MAG: helix-turn-helix transcriptional regulator [Ruminococcus sp.]|nr:helix-turn-helix transcriptional regulator [Ruminococcus sp.]
MKISEIEINCRRSFSLSGGAKEDMLLYFFKTPVTYTINGKETKSESISAVICSPETKIHIRSLNGTNMKFDYVRFEMTAAERHYAASKNISFDTPIILNDDFVISSVFKNMKTESTKNSKYSNEFLELSMRMILICLSESAPVQNEDISVRTDIPKYSKLKSLREQVYENPVIPWDIEIICERLCISRTYFHRLYSAAFGVTFRQDVIESRLLMASDLLVSTDLSVSEIAEKCGYESDSYFMQQFRRHKGCTPTQYRRKSESRNIDFNA